MNSEKYLTKIAAAIDGFEYDEKPLYLYERIQRVKEILKEWKSERDNLRMVGEKRSLRFEA